MSREILFKAKQANNGEWVEGYYARYGFTGKEKHYIVPVYASDLYAFEVTRKPSANTQDLPTRTVRRFGRVIFYEDMEIIRTCQK